MIANVVQYIDYLLLLPVLSLYDRKQKRPKTKLRLDYRYYSTWYPYRYVVHTWRVTCPLELETGPTVRPTKTYDGIRNLEGKNRKSLFLK